MTDDVGEDQHFLMDCWKYNFYDNTSTETAFASLLQSEEPSALWNSDNFIYHEQVATPVGAAEVTEGRRSTRVQKTSLGRPLVNDLCLEIVQREDDYVLLDPYRYGEKGGVVENIDQPFQIVVHPQVSLICDIHAHLSAAEIIGFLAGKYFSERRVLYIQAAIPCTSSEQGGKDVVMDYNAQIRASEVAQRAGMSIVGWYHSHPTFCPNPSFIDLNNHQSIAQLTKEANSDIEPCVGLIVSTFPKGSTSPIASHEWFTTKFYDRGFADMWMPVRPIVDYPSLQCDDNEAPAINLAEILESLEENINNSFHANEAERLANDNIAKDPNPVVKQEAVDVMDVDETPTALAAVPAKEDENLKIITQTTPRMTTVSEEDVDYLIDLTCQETNPEPITNTVESAESGEYFTETAPVVDTLPVESNSSAAYEDIKQKIILQVAMDTCETATMVSGQSPTKSTTCPSTIVASDDSIQNGSKNHEDNQLPMLIPEQDTKQTITGLKAAPAPFEVGTRVRLLAKNSTRSRIPHLINMIGYIRELPVREGTCFTVEFPANENKALKLLKSVLQPVDERGQPLTNLATPRKKSTLKKKRGLPDPIEDLLPTTKKGGGRRSKNDDTTNAIDLTTIAKTSSDQPSLPKPPSLFTSIVFAINNSTLTSSALARRLLEQSPLELRLTTIIVINLVYHYCRNGQRMKLLDEMFNKNPKIDKLYASAQSCLERFVFTQPKRREEFAKSLYRFIHNCWGEFSSVTGQLKYKQSENGGEKERPKRIVVKARQPQPTQYTADEETESPRADVNGKQLSNRSSNSGRPIRKKTPKKERD